MELMFSLERMLEITGNTGYADHLERIVFNTLSTQVSDNFMYKQYFQQPNQILATRASRNFYEDDPHVCTDVVFGTLTGFPCCYSSMHQGWPKFTRDLWFATVDRGVAAMVYSPSEVSLKVVTGREVTIVEETCYPMSVTVSSWHEKSAAVERGPLVYALPLSEQWEYREFPDKEKRQFGEEYYEVRSSDRWNYGMLEDFVNSPETHCSVAVDSVTAGEDNIESKAGGGLETIRGQCRSCRTL